MDIKGCILAVLVAGGVVAPDCMAAEVDHGDRPLYGFFLSNPLGFTNAPNENYGFAKQTFADLTNSELMYGLSGGIGVYAATAIDGIYYAAPYYYGSSMSMPEPRPMFTYNIYNGRVREIGNWSDGATDLKPSDMTYDRKTDRILAICYGSAEGGGVYEVDRNTGAMKLICKMNNGGGVIAADPFGRIFSINHNGELLQLDLTRENSAKAIYQLPYAYLSANQSLEFDYTTGKLYWAANTLENPHNDQGHGTWLVEITLPNISPDMDYSGDMAGYSYQEIDEIGLSARFQGMYIPYATGGFDAPGFAEDVKPVSSPDGSYCTIEFKVPATTLAGDPLASIDGYDIYRDGTRIHTGKGAVNAGETVKYEDKAIPETGKEYRYDVICYSNVKGDGPKSPAFAYVGFDSPDAVTDADVAVSDDFMSTTVTWTAPTVGQHGGTFDPSKTTYDVTRLPDNVKVAEDITECRITDNLRRLMRYSYQITAKNEFGATKTETRDFVAGTPVSELPLEETFDNPTAFKLRWNSIDNNGDGMTWIYGTTLGMNVFGDYEMTAEYIISPTSVDAFTKDADDWIISPPIKFADGERYTVTFDIRSLTNENLNVYVGPRNEVEGMRLVKSFTLNKPQYTDDEAGRMIFQKYSFDLPEDIAGTTACVAIQIATPLNEQYYSYIQLGNILIDNAESGVQDILSGESHFRISNGVLTIDGEYGSASLYDMNGVRIRDIRNSETSVSGLHGVYILMIDGVSKKIVM